MKTDYEIFEASSMKSRRMLREEELILQVAEELSRAMEKEGISKSVLAERLNKTKGVVSHLLSGSQNLTLRTISDVADALGYEVEVMLTKRQ